MNILVALKPVLDPTRPVHFFTPDSVTDAPWPAPHAGQQMDEQSLINPFDEIALEAAIRWRESGIASQVTVITVGPSAWEAYLRTALAMGADRAVRIEAPAALEPFAVAQSLAAFVKEAGTELLLTGRQAVDAGYNQTGEMTAALLGWGAVSHATRIEFQDREAVVLRGVENGLERWAVKLPAVITVEWSLNAIHTTGGPRYASLPNIMKARRKPLDQLSPDRWGVHFTPRLHHLALQPPAPRPAGKPLRSVAELLDVLQQGGFL
ncbi:MAG: electron transfer flavoprotein subunit beta/FixA family protein [Magnetococcales bacterium]|nr:electron transfer flavoprotein subunit beta/FixA family protein [Magnetococcales bacterium]